jgi:hypothetical protein
MTPIEVLKMLKSKIDLATADNCNYAIETSDIEAIDKTLLLHDVRVRLTASEKAKAASKWATERSEGDRDVDRQCYYDYLMGMEEAERMLK